GSEQDGQGTHRAECTGPEVERRRRRVAVLQTGLAANMECLKRVLRLDRKDLLEAAHVIRVQLVSQVRRVSNHNRVRVRAEIGRVARKHGNHRSQKDDAAEDQYGYARAIPAEPESESAA